MTEQELRRALTRSLSDELPAQTRRAVLAKVRERERPVLKHKFSVGLIFAIVLMLLSTVALAITLSREYFEDVARMQFESGWYEDWGLKEKLAMVDILEEYGIISETQAKDMDDEESIDAFMIERYGVEGSDRIDTIGIYSILDKELGEIHTWSLEQKAWYTDMMIRVGLLTKDNDDFICALPEATDTQPEEAVAIAKAAITEAYGLDADALDAHRVDIAFETYTSDWERENLHYNINFWGDGLKYYSCSITRDGHVMDSMMDKYILSPAEQVEVERREAAINSIVSANVPQGPESQWSLEDKARLLGADNGIPREGDITQEAAVTFALNRFRDLGYDLQDYDISVWYKLYDDYEEEPSAQDPVYVIYFTDDLNAPTKVFSMVIDADTGKIVVEYAPAPCNG